MLAVPLLLLGSLHHRPERPPTAAQLPAPQRLPPAVAALGRLEPSGDLRRLAAPISGIGGSPRLIALLVQEGDRVQAGQLLARFDTAPPLLAQSRLLDHRIANLRRRLALETHEISRYRSLARGGVIPGGELERRESDLLELRGQLEEALAERLRVARDLELTELRAPLDGVVLRLHARVGERPTDRGVLELGDSDRMEALVEVYESDISRVRLGQSVSLTSENGGFSGRLRGRVVRISPQVRQREILSTDPTGDADARIVEIRVALTPRDQARVRQLAGLKVIARMQP